MPIFEAFRIEGCPMPESSCRCGVWIAPAERITSLRAEMMAPLANVMPMARSSFFFPWPEPRFAKLILVTCVSEDLQVRPGWGEICGGAVGSGVVRGIDVGGLE